MFRLQTSLQGQFFSTVPKKSLDIQPQANQKLHTPSHSSLTSPQFLGTKVSNTKNISVFIPVSILACLPPEMLLHLHTLVTLLTSHASRTQFSRFYHSRFRTSNVQGQHKKMWAQGPSWHQYLYGSMVEHKMGKIRVRLLVLLKEFEPLQGSFHILQLFSVPELFPLHME